MDWAKEKLRGKTSAPNSLGQIVKYIEDEFGVPISTGNVHQKNAQGIFKNKPEDIRTKVSNNLPTILYLSNEGQINR